MKYLLSAAALFAATVFADKRDLCSDGSTDDGGNWYCQEVTGITYTGVGGSGSYNKVTNMDSGSGSCSNTGFGYSGTLAPLDQEVSVHFRGPLQLLQFAYYSPGSSSSKSKREEHARRHVHHRHARGHQHHARDPEVGAVVTATIDGKIQTWANEYSGGQSTSAAASSYATSAPSSAASSSSASSSASSSSDSSDSSSSSSSSSSDGSSSVSGGWSRQAYYDASSGSSDGLVFLNHFGGSGSGTFDNSFGNSLSYASSDGTSGSSSAQTLEQTTLPSSAEVVIMTDSKCGDNNGACGYYRDGIEDVAYHGFNGSSKAFFFEFVMPDSGETSNSQYEPVNMPAIWILNALIPRTLQYGQEDCSCWQSGCGEFDLFEVLAAGDTRMKSTLHGNIAGGDSDYFSRPTSSPIKAAMVMYDNNIHLKILDNSTDFGSSLDSDTLNDIVSSTSQQTNSISLFSLSG